jgi:hypothetical protein
MSVKCPECDSHDILIEDEGVGDYEYWGAPGSDVRLVGTCLECDYWFNVSEHEVRRMRDAERADYLISMRD